MLLYVLDTSINCLSIKTCMHTLELPVDNMRPSDQLTMIKCIKNMYTYNLLDLNDHTHHSSPSAHRTCNPQW